MRGFIGERGSEVEGWSDVGEVNGFVKISWISPSFYLVDGGYKSPSPSLSFIQNCNSHTQMAVSAGGRLYVQPPEMVMEISVPKLSGYP